MKTLITAETVKSCHKKGEKVISAPLSCTIVTPEAKDLAAKFGISLDHEPPSRGSSTSASSDGPNIATTTTHDVDIAHIQQCVTQQMPSGKHDSAAVEALIKKALSELNQGASAEPGCQKQISEHGVVLVRGNSVSMGRLDAVKEHNIGLTDVITAKDNSNIGAGYMSWENGFFPWTLTYDEVDVVLEGELHIKSGDQTFVGKPGDVMFIPKGSSIEFGTPTSVRFVYVTYPVDWA
ncbi:Ethanolamine utilization protein EutQ [BD1-7 clade bacterium]|uniref:Ethanolamine utilization protein EutQ n=1 Tax=BD1-7 clade bacterium TaxID=2029982 RepID=A0A5S9QHK1_9GAMM|nr:Ethanolamine utilization protein EutQ [BD1-7 clade bacterium]CAA0117150.1 Ethanolamine utilization protein EutQ [BD1-7 clade bacterium]